MTHICAEQWTVWAVVIGASWLAWPVSRALTLTGKLLPHQGGVFMNDVRTNYGKMGLLRSVEFWSAYAQRSIRQTNKRVGDPPQPFLLTQSQDIFRPSEDGQRRQRGSIKSTWEKIHTQESG